MPTPTRLSIRPLSSADLPAMLHLSTQAGWNQLPADWQRLLRLWPAQCLGGWLDSQLVATATLAAYGQHVGWVGMVLVEQDARGRGFGGQILHATLRLGDQLGIPCLGLDATDLGQPVYARCGFETVSLIDRWTVSARAALGSVAAIPSAASPDIDWPQIERLDRAETGLSRRPLLQTLAAEPGAAIRTVRAGGNLLAFGLARPGRLAAHIGPLIATDPAAAADLFDDLLSHVAAHTDLDTVFVDVPRNSALTAHLEKRGFAIARRLARMLRPAASCLSQTSRVFAISGFELG